MFDASGIQWKNKHNFIYRVKIFACQTKGTYIPPQAEVLAHWEGVLRSSGTVFTRTAAVNAKVAVEDGILGPERAVSNVLI